ncbi:hypothetical protein NDU88_005669 [Pleurodeles waltl]|uniref:Uncharacterized protein n=1 Tax=Pleurodeles waltl TaxID=8319 RepID=A0AAV7MHM0_PLEWA|nr:hypothetical protein NDU88_005669 [Pleurodeles waltl]
MALKLVPGSENPVQLNDSQIALVSDKLEDSELQMLLENFREVFDSKIGVDSAAISDLEGQHTSANPRSRPGYERQMELFRAVTRFINGEGSDENGTDEWRTLSWETAKEDARRQ